MVVRKEDRCLRPLNFVIIDEIDSILIDEARTPLIISGGRVSSANLYKEADRAVKSLHVEKDYTVAAKLITSILNFNICSGMLSRTGKGHFLIFLFSVIDIKNCGFSQCLILKITLFLFQIFL